MRVAMFIIAVSCVLSGCMSISITAREGSTVYVQQDKPITADADATIPSGAVTGI
jgi:uncharacterized protein YceK